MEIQIINQKDDRSEEFKKSNPAVSFDKLNKDRPYAICLFNVGKMPEACCKLIFETKGEVFTAQELEKKIKEQTLVQLFSAATEELLQKIAADFRAVGAGVEIIALDDKNSYQLILLSAGEKQQEVQELASNYISEKQCSPVVLLNGTTQKDAEICKAQFDAIGAETVILPFHSVSDKKTKHSCSIRLTSKGSDPIKVAKLCSCFGVSIEPNEEDTYPIHLLSADAPEKLSAHLRCLRNAGATVWIKDKRNNASTCRVLLLRYGENREQVQALLKNCAMNTQIQFAEEVTPPVEIMERVTPEDAALCQQYFAQAGAVTVILNSNVVFNMGAGSEYKFMLYTSSPGKNPEAVAVLLNLMRNKNESVDEIFKDNLTPVVFTKEEEALVSYQEALLEYGASAWIMNIEDADESYNLYVTKIEELNPELKRTLIEIQGYRRNITESLFTPPINLLINSVKRDVERCERMLNKFGVELQRFRSIPMLAEADKKEYELMVFNKGEAPERMDILMQCCISPASKEKLSLSDLPLSLCAATSSELLNDRAECLRNSGASAWVCSRSGTQATYKVVITDFGSEPEKVIALIRKYAFNYQLWQNRIPAAPIVIMKNLIQTESAALGAMCKECGAEISYIKEEKDQEPQNPYCMLITSLGENPDVAEALLQAWDVAESEIKQIRSGNAIHVCRAKEEKDLQMKLDLFRKAGSFVWVTTPNDIQKTYKVILNSMGPHKEQVMDLLKHFPNYSCTESENESCEIIKNLTRNSALECCALFRQNGADVDCCNLLGEKINLE